MNSGVLKAVLLVAAVGGTPPPRVLQTASTYHNFTAVVDTTFVDSSSPLLSDYVVNALLPEALLRIGALVRVRGNTTIPALTTVNTCFNDVLIPTKYTTGETSGDLLLFLSVTSNPFKQATSSIVCTRDGNGRPNVALLFVNQLDLDLSFNNTNHAIKLIQRELIKILGFSIDSFNYFPGGASATYTQTSRTTVAGARTAYKLISKEVVAWARTHFACASLDGVQLEDDADFTGGETFWEQTVLGPELMAPMPAYNAPLSMFTLAVLIDSSWYSVNTTLAEQLEWGSGAGCSFFDISACASSAPEFCKREGGNFCSRKRVYRTRCSLTPYSNGCLVALPSGNSRCAAPPSAFQYLYDDESPGPMAKCQNVTVGTVPSAACLATTCHLNGSLHLTFSGVKHECTATNQTMRVAGNMNLTCPNFRQTCFDTVCAGQCYGSGACREAGGCTCDYFYTGDNCQAFGGCRSNSSNVCAAIAPPSNQSFASLPIQNFNLTFWGGRLAAAAAMIVILAAGL